ncbi:S-layer family protein [Geitlerinema sp. PCC 7407]|uniref:filamentous hemagglutinin N-terminal domain-containing protein n=1 Tax=Geitlerinema sp. PCC 7407 TaxID=1173025 RepID=UPI0009DAFF5B|nr:S-layer family protein [Geitlerinema sp. PCC 7407]
MQRLIFSELSSRYPMIQRSPLRIFLLWRATAILAGMSFLLVHPCTAQVLPDSSLGAERSVITPEFDPSSGQVDIITGGAQRGTNLFHSFQEFNIGGLQRVYFASPGGVENILSRVTGPTSSTILGTLGVLGDANLFLINPNGIVFGPDASLDLRGSFTGSTAQGIKFADGTEFKADNAASTPLLTITVPTGLQFYGTEGDILVQTGQVVSLNSFTETSDVGEGFDSNSIINDPRSGETFDAISGSLSREGDVDLYPLFLQKGEPFVASTVAGTNLNTELFLFDSRGFGIAANNDSVGIQSTVPLYEPFIPDRSGIYYLGISNYPNQPISEQGSIFDFGENPRGPGASMPLSGWDGTPSPAIRSSTGPYTIKLGPRPNGLQVRPGKSLAFIGREIRIEGGRLEAPGGRIELAGISGAGVVEIVQQGQNVSLSIPEGITRGNVDLANDAVISVAADQGGSITLYAQEVNLSDSSLIAGISPGLGEEGLQSGGISIQAARAVTLDESSVVNDIAPDARGNGGGIRISTGSLSIMNGSGLYSRVFGEGNAGDIQILARDDVRLDYSLSVSAVAPFGKGQGGDIQIDANSLFVTNIGQLVALTQGEGNAGNVIINARDTVLFDGKDSRLPLASSAFSSVGSSSIEGRNARGQGGDIRISARAVVVANGGRLLANTNAFGDAGNISLYARDSIRFEGGSEASSNVSSMARGNGGTINVIAGDSLSVQRGSKLEVSSSGAGLAGSLSAEAETIQLSDGGVISANTTSGGGDINLRSPLIILRRNSSITTNATGTATGGNIAVDAGFVVSAPNENNDIIANGFEGSGGQVRLAAEKTFWIDLRSREDLQLLLGTTDPAKLDPRLLSTNDVTAFSQANPSIDTGRVMLQTPDLDPTRGMTALPENLVDPGDLVTATCSVNQRSSFAMTGRGGIPEDPRQPLVGQVLWQDGRSGDRKERSSTPPGPMSSSSPIVEAQSWMIDRDGKVTLVAAQPDDRRETALRRQGCAVSQTSP